MYCAVIACAKPANHGPGGTEGHMVVHRTRRTAQLQASFLTVTYVGGLKGYKSAWLHGLSKQVLVPGRWGLKELRGRKAGGPVVYCPCAQERAIPGNAWITCLS